MTTLRKIATWTAIGALFIYAGLEAFALLCWEMAKVAWATLHGGKSADEQIGGGK